MPVPLALLAIGGGLQLGAAALDAYRKSELAKQQEAEAAALKQQDLTPPSLKEAMATSRMAQGANMPGYQSALQALDQTTASNVRAAQQNARGGSLVGAIQLGLQARNRALSGLATQNANFQVAERRNLQGLQGQAAGYEAQSKAQFDRTKAALKQAAIQNREGAIRDITGAVSGIGSGLATVGGQQAMMGAAGGTGVANQTPMPNVSMPAQQTGIYNDMDLYSGVGDFEGSFMYRPQMRNASFMLRRQGINLPTY